MKLIKAMTAVMAAAGALTICTAVTAYAEDKVSKERIIDELWGTYYERGYEGGIYPESSLYYHVLENWIDAHYDEDGNDFYDMYSINQEWSRYFNNEYKEEWEWDSEDSEEYYTVRNKDTDEVYTIDLDENGMWVMLDGNGKVYDTFEPHGGDNSMYKGMDLSDIGVFDYNYNGRRDEIQKELNGGEAEEEVPEENESELHGENDNNDTSTPRVTGMKQSKAGTAKSSKTESSSEAAAAAGSASAPDSAEKSEKSSAVPLVIGIVAFGGVAAGVIYAVRKRGKK